MLTDEHMSMLERCTPKFLAADANDQEKMIKNAADHIKRTWSEDTEFDRDSVMGVCDLSAISGHSHIFLAHLPTFVRQI